MRPITALPAAVGAAAVLATGCAGTQTTAARHEVDYEKVAQIERAARAMGTQIIWVNYPTKRADRDKR